MVGTTFWNISECFGRYAKKSSLKTANALLERQQPDSRPGKHDPNRSPTVDWIHHPAWLCARRTLPVITYEYIWHACRGVNMAHL